MERQPPDIQHSPVAKEQTGRQCEIKSLMAETQKIQHQETRGHSKRGLTGRLRTNLALNPTVIVEFG